MGQQIAKEEISNLNCKLLKPHVNRIIHLLVDEKELQKLYKNFSKIDKDKSGMLEPSELFDIPGKLTKSPC